MKEIEFHSFQKVTRTDQNRVRLFTLPLDFVTGTVDLNLYPRTGKNGKIKVFLTSEGSGDYEFVLFPELSFPSADGEDKYIYLPNIMLGRGQSVWVEAIDCEVNVYGTCSSGNSPYVYKSGHLSNISLTPSNIKDDAAITLYEAAYPLTSYCSLNIFIEAIVGTGNLTESEISLWAMTEDDMFLDTNRIGTFNFKEGVHRRTMRSLTLAYGEKIVVTMKPIGDEIALPLIMDDCVTLTVMGNVVGGYRRKELQDMFSIKEGGE